MATRIDVVRRALRHIGRLDLVSNPVAEHQEYAVSTLLSLLAELRTRLIVWWLPADDDSLIPDIALGPLSEALGGRIAGALYSDRSTGRTGNLQAEGMAAEGRLMCLNPTNFVVARPNADYDTINGVSGIGTTTYSQVIGDGINTSFIVSHMLNSTAVNVSVYRNSTPFDLVLADVSIVSADSIRVTFGTMPTVNQWRVVVQK